VKKFDLKQIKWVIIRKAVIFALIIITCLALGVMRNYADVLANQVNVGASFDVMKGNTGTVEGFAAHKVTAAALEIGKIIAAVILFALCVAFFIDICIDAYKFYKRNEEGEK